MSTPQVKRREAFPQARPSVWRREFLERGDDSMSSEDWRERIRRLQGNDQLATMTVIVCVLALIVHEGAKLIQGTPVTNASGDQISKILIGILAAMTYSKCRQTHKDVMHDVGATTEIRETMQQEVAPAIRGATEKLDTDAQAVVNSLVVQHNAAWEKMIQDRRVERHDLLGQLQAASALRTESEHENKSLREKLSLLEGMLATKVRSEERAADRAEDRAVRDAEGKH